MYKKNYRESLWIAIRFIQLPLDVLGEKWTKPTVVIENNQVYACSSHAEKMNIHPGISEAKAQLHAKQFKKINSTKTPVDSPSYINTIAREKHKEEQSLFDLCDELYLITPYIKSKNKNTKKNILEQGLILEISTSINLFKGVYNIEKRIRDILAKKNYLYILTYGDTEERSWLVTYQRDYKDKYLESYNNIDNGIKEKTYNIIKNMPIDYLYDFPKEVEKLNNMGFMSFGDLINPKKNSSFPGIRKRLGSEFTLHLSKIIDLQKEQQSSLFISAKPLYEPKETFKETLNFDYPITNIENIKPYIEELLIKLHNNFSQKNQESHEVIWLFYDIKNNKKEYSITFDPKSFQWNFIYDLSLIQLEHRGLPFEVNSIQLQCLHTDSRHYENFNLMLSDSNKNQTTLLTPELPLLKNEYSIVTAKLQSRIGQKAIKKIRIENTHIPEKASIEYDFNDQDENIDSKPAVDIANRPEWLFKVPKAIGRQQNQLNWQGKLNIIQGPERIQGNWWHKPIARDYFIAQRDDFTRLWIYHDLKQDQWYAQGIFA